MYDVPSARPTQRQSRLWHLFWLLLIGMLGSGAIMVTAALTQPICHPACPPLVVQPIPAKTGDALVIVVWPLLAWAAALGYGWRWAGRRLSWLSGARLLAAPAAYGLIVPWWSRALPSAILPRAAAELRPALVLALPFMALLFLSHLDFLLRPGPPRSPAGPDLH